jgi:TRAP-type C4-dicarboxylate transport system substrate-binding protein
MSRRLIASIAAGLALAAVASAPSPGLAAPLVMKIGTATVHDSTVEWMKLFAKDVEADSGGRIRVEIYPASQLGSSPRMIEQTQLGAIQGVVGAPEFLTGVDSRYQVLGSPGLFKDLAHTNRVLQDPAFNKAFLGLGADKGLKGIGLLIGGPTVFVTRNRVQTLSDLRGLKIRVLAGRLQSAQVRSLGAVPVPMPLAEVYPALQQGLLDGVMSNTNVMLGLHLYDAAKYLLETNHALIAAIAVISKTWFDRLPPDLQQIVVADGQKASAEVYQYSADDINRSRKLWIQHGGEVKTLSPAEQDKMMHDLVAVGAAQFAGNPAEKAMFNLLRETAERTAG